MAELAHFGKSAVLIPYPYAAEDHQRVNAELGVKNGAQLLDQKDLSAESLAAAMEALLKAGEFASLKELAVEDSSGFVIRRIFPTL